MPRIYKRHCKQCGKYYESSAKYFCSFECYIKSGQMSLIAKGKQYWLGKKHDETTKRKIGAAQTGSKNHNYGEKASEKTIKKMQKSHKGLNTWSKGRKLTEEHKTKIGDSQRGDKCYAWRGGISFEPYSTDWTETLRRAIRERDNYICQLCGKLQGDHAHDVHHIDYNKKDCDPLNLITLCHGCNAKANSNREFWTNYFKNKMKKYVD